MIVALLIVILLVLLFGAAAVKGWIKGAVAVGGGALVVLLAVGFAASRYRSWQDDRQHQSLIQEARPLILRDVSQKAGVRQVDLIDIVSYDQGSEIYLCGSISGTSGYGGANGRRRFLSNGGNTELEREHSKNAFDQRQALHCTSDPTGAILQ